MIIEERGYSMPTFQYGTTAIEYDIEYADDKKDVSIIVE